ncbi:MAG TPA: acetyl-CoA C-acyltransferase, partial [Candidatus Saccharimonadia bacterium]|nr:acetyl-CoA C-acyltransferase [Candidatus Saccharimonadia bacterium]
MNAQLPRRAAILGGMRIPFCRSNTAYVDVGNFGMSVKAVASLVERYNLAGEELGEVALGAVIKHSSDWNLGREVTLSSGLSPRTPGITMARACGTGLDTTIHIANKVALNQIDAGVAGGSDTTSDVPIVYSKEFGSRILATARAKSLQQRAVAWKGFGVGELKPHFPGVAEPRTGKSMGDHCESMAKEWGIPREDQDRIALASHQKAAAAYDRGFHDDLVVEFRGVKRDNNLRPDTSLEKLGQL